MLECFLDSEINSIRIHSETNIHAQVYFLLFVKQKTQSRTICGFQVAYLKAGNKLRERLISLLEDLLPFGIH